MTQEEGALLCKTTKNIACSKHCPANIVQKAVFQQNKNSNRL